MSERTEENLPSVAGRRLTQPTEDFIRACRVQLADMEENTVNADPFLRALLCDAVRLARELDDTQHVREVMLAGGPHAYPLFAHMSKAHDRHLLDSELDDIRRICRELDAAEAQAEGKQ